MSTTLHFFQFVFDRIHKGLPISRNVNLASHSPGTFGRALYDQVINEKDEPTNFLKLVIKYKERMGGRVQVLVNRDRRIVRFNDPKNGVREIPVEGGVIISVMNTLKHLLSADRLDRNLPPSGQPEQPTRRPRL